ncbi:hypothetical protein ACCS66_35475 [Rhizobium ruizarguesonis]
MTGLGAASIGAVAALIAAGRIIRERPVGVRARLRFAAWAITLMAGVTFEAALIAGPEALPWLGAGATAGGLARRAMSSAWN